MSTGVFAGEVPRFDPMKFVSDEPAERAPDTNGADAPGAEVSVRQARTPEVGVEAGAPALGDDDVTAQVEEERRIAAEAGRRTALPLAPQIMLSRTLQQGLTRAGFRYRELRCRRRAAPSSRSRSWSSPRTSPSCARSSSGPARRPSWRKRTSP